ncbi:MAG: hypothetical protein ACREOC_06745 [Gemmatimonadales bacterium]
MSRSRSLPARASRVGEPGRRTAPGGDYQPQWSPDASRVIFFSAREGNNDVWTA